MRLSVQERGRGAALSDPVQREVTGRPVGKDTQAGALRLSEAVLGPQVTSLDWGLASLLSYV